MLDGFDPAKDPYDPARADEDEYAKQLYWEDQPVPVLTPEQLRAVEFGETGIGPQDRAVLKALLAALTEEQREQVRIEKLRRAHLPPVLGANQVEALQRLESARQLRISDSGAQFRAELAALAGLTDRERRDVLDVADRRRERRFQENLPWRLAEKARAAMTPEQLHEHLEANRARSAELERWAQRESRAMVERQRRAPDSDPRYGDANPWPAPVALERTGREKLIRVFAEARGKVVHRRGAKLEPGWLVYSVWANKVQHAVFLAERELFAAGPGEPGVRMISNGDDGSMVQQAQYLERRQSD